MTFDGDGKISQMRQTWDQGALLKQLDVIGRTGRNWPIRDSKEQLKLIASSVRAAGGASKPPSGSELVNRSRGNSTNILRDPHASLALFAPREDVGNVPESVVSPYAGSRPRQRSFTEILGDEPVEAPATPSNDRGRSQSPSKAIAPKGGASKNFQPIRLFDTDEGVEEDPATTSNDRGRPQSPSKAIAPKGGASKNFQPIRLFDPDEGVESGPDTRDKSRSPERHYRPNPTKYQHFDFADGSDPQDAPKAGVTFDKTTKSRHDSNWSFEDFVTPQKAGASKGGSHRPQDVRHWGTENDQVAESPEKRVQQIKPRRDAEKHFEFRDDGLPANEQRLIGRPRGAGHNTGLGLYQNNVYREDGSAPTPGPDARALGNITNVKDRRKDFDAHFAFTDASPHNGNGNSQPKDADVVKVSDDRKKAVKMMESNWAGYDESPVSQKENSNPSRPLRAETDAQHSIATAGDGMGGRKGAGRGWGIGDESDNEGHVRAVPGKQQGSQKSHTAWDF